MWWLDKIAISPAAAALAAVAYECFLFGFNLLAKTWKEIEPEVIRALSTSIREGALNLMSRFRRDYLQQIVWDHRTFNVRGLRTQGAYTIDLAQVFVELRIAPSHLQQASADPLAGRELPDAGMIWDFLRPIQLKGATALSIIGPPGSGKTTLLQHVALTFATNRQRRFKLPALVPIILFLRDHVDSLSQEAPPPLASLADALARRACGQTPPSGWFEKMLRSGRAIVLLDGLDEVAKADQRVRVSQWVERQISLYPRCPFVLTARPEGYRSAPLQRTHVLEVLPFGPEQVRKFIHNWYLATEVVKHGGKLDGGVRQASEQRAQDLILKLRGHHSFSGLTRNPLLLTMIAMVHNYRGALPGRRVELYAEICDVLLGHWQKAKGVEAPLTAAQIRVALQPLAAQMMVGKTREIRTNEALNTLLPALEKVGVSGDAAQVFLQDVQARSGLILEREQGLWAFAHLTFQEYLAATHFHEKGWPLDLPSIVDDSWWHECLRLYAAQA
ncbi:MAG TPA: NACHT domain-containing protein, partial [Myxococcus sp.]|nr:NACHT domain-containing protein [Myxococcus sp.]